MDVDDAHVGTGAVDRRDATMRTRTLVALAVVAVLLPAAGGAGGVWRVRAALAAGVRAGQLASARSAAIQASLGLSFGENLVRAAARRPGLQTALAAGDRTALVGELRSTFTTAPLVSAVAVFDRDGALVAQFPSSPPYPLAHVEASSDTTVLRAEPVSGGSDARVTIVEPIPDAAGTVVGTVAGDLSLRRVAPVITRLRFGRTGTATLLERSGRVLVTGEPRRRGRTITTPQIVAMLDRWHDDTAAYTGTLVPRREIAAFAPVEGTDWGVLVTQAQSEAFAAARELVRWLVAGLVLLIAVGFGIAFVWSRATGRYQRHLAEELGEQRRLNDALDAFSGRVAHDLRNPLAAIRMSAEMIASGGAEQRLDERSRRSLEILQRQADRALELIDDLLALARASGTPAPEPVRLAAILAEASEGLEQLDVELTANGVVLFADPVPLRAALGNLLRNAVKYAAVDGRAHVTVSCTESSDRWRLSVADRGPGLPFEQADVVFRPFERAGRRGKDGTGLGLTIVAATAESHGGRAGYREREGGGAEFWLEFPKPPAMAAPGRV